MSNKRQASLSPEQKQTPRTRKEMALTEASFQRMMKEMLTPIEAKLDSSLSRMEQLHIENKELKLEVQTLKSRCELMEKTQQRMESRARERILMIDSPKAQESAHEIVGETLKALGLETIKVSKVETIWTNNKERQLVAAELESREAVFNCLKSGIRLKGSNTYIHKDFTAEERLIRGAAMSLRRDLLERDPKELVKITGKGLKAKSISMELRRSWDAVDGAECITNGLSEYFPNLNPKNLKEFMTSRKTNISIDIQTIVKSPQQQQDE